MVSLLEIKFYTHEIYSLFYYFFTIFLTFVCLMLFATLYFSYITHFGGLHYVVG
jgi:hypothetical protein